MSKRGLHGSELREYVNMHDAIDKFPNGKKINYWTILNSLQTHGHAHYECQCDCGEIALIEARELHAGRSKCCKRCWRSGIYPELYLNEDHTTAEERERYVRYARIKNGYNGS
jgi:hypothetical protein